MWPRPGGGDAQVNVEGWLWVVALIDSSESKTLDNRVSGEGGSAGRNDALQQRGKRAEVN